MDWLAYPEVLKGVGYVIGALVLTVLGALGGRKIPLTRREWVLANGNSNGHIRPSKKTGGALNISEEARSKLRDLEQRLRTEYLTEHAHELICGKALAEFTNAMSEKLERKMDERFEAFEEKIINTITELMEE